MIACRTVRCGHTVQQRYSSGATTYICVASSLPDHAPHCAVRQRSRAAQDRRLEHRAATREPLTGSLAEALQHTQEHMSVPTPPAEPSSSGTQHHRIPVRFSWARELVPWQASSCPHRRSWLPPPASEAHWATSGLCAPVVAACSAHSMLERKTVLHADSCSLTLCLAWCMPVLDCDHQQTGPTAPLRCCSELTKLGLQTAAIMPS